MDMEIEIKESLKECQTQIKIAKSYLLSGGKDNDKVIMLLDNALFFLNLSEIFQKRIDDKKQKNKK